MQVVSAELPCVSLQTARRCTLQGVCHPPQVRPGVPKNRWQLRETSASCCSDFGVAGAELLCSKLAAASHKGTAAALRGSTTTSVVLNSTSTYTTLPQPRCCRVHGVAVSHFLRTWTPQHCCALCMSAA